MFRDESNSRSNNYNSLYPRETQRRSTHKTLLGNSICVRSWECNSVARWTVTDIDSNIWRLKPREARNELNGAATRHVLIGESVPPRRSQPLPSYHETGSWKTCSSLAIVQESRSPTEALQLACLTSIACPFLRALSRPNSARAP